MSELTGYEQELVAIGASIGSNCVPCVAFHVKRAKVVGLEPDKIRAAVALAQEIRAVPAELVVNTALAHLGTIAVEEPCECTGEPSCGC